MVFVVREGKLQDAELRRSLWAVYSVVLGDLVEVVLIDRVKFYQNRV